MTVKVQGARVVGRRGIVPITHSGLRTRRNVPQEPRIYLSCEDLDERVRKGTGDVLCNAGRVQCKLKWHINMWQSVWRQVGGRRARKRIIDGS